MTRNGNVVPLLSLQRQQRRDVAPGIDERAWQYTPVACTECGVVVQVAKFSLQHTSVQWSAEAVRGCAEFAAGEAAGRTSALIPTCVRLRDSIEDAVAGGRVEVLPP